MELQKSETELWQIVRMHSSDIKIKIEFSPDYGTIFYHVLLEVREGRELRYMRYHNGRNLYKRYNEIIKVLTELYGANLHKHNGCILNANIQKPGFYPFHNQYIKSL